jgi:hypothetical protein
VLPLAQCCESTHTSRGKVCLLGPVSSAVVLAHGLSSAADVLLRTLCAAGIGRTATVASRLSVSDGLDALHSGRHCGEGCAGL